MIQRELAELPAHVYPPDEWRLVERRFYPRNLAHCETLFSTANGYFGIRGAFEEGAPVYRSGTWVNGFHETWPIIYGEKAYGFAETGQTMIRVTDAKLIRLYVDDEPLHLPSANLRRFERSLDMKNGTLDREMLWETPAGKQVLIKQRRLVSFPHRHLAAIFYEVTVLNAAAPVVISSEMVYDDHRQTNEDDPRLGQGLQGRALYPEKNYVRGTRAVLSHTTQRSRMTLACGMDHVVETASPCSTQSDCSEDSARVVFSVDAQPRVPIRLTKYMTYHTCGDDEPHELCQRSERALDRAAQQGFEKLLAEQRAYMDEFWRRADVRLEGNPAAQQAIRFNLFQILQAAGRADGAGVPAKGLTGPGYEGHYFWDAEIYVLPFLVYTHPRLAKNLLLVRSRQLQKARERARKVGQKGALFPWRTINGEEASAYYAAGTAQYHINADIVYALRKYVEITGDEVFLRERGAELLVETARLWFDLGFYSERKGGQFSIHGVTGPDEYNTVVDNNTYTNMMARENLWYAVRTVRTLRSEEPKRFAALVHETGLDPTEVGEWERAADSMYVPYDEELGIHPQDDSFLDKKPWDFKNTPADHYPLLLHYHPLVIYRSQVIKQADVVLAMFLLGDEFSQEQKRRNFEFYDKLTTGDSSLSVSVQSILAFELDYPDKAGEYARYSLLMDLADVGGNVKDGCHIASMGGTWMAMIYGFAGMRDYDGRVSFRPRMPRKQLDRVSFRLTIRGQLLEVAINRESASYTLMEGDGLTIWHEDEEIALTPDVPAQSRPHD